jgi:addiction module RelB/DinJ family antitoxin
MSNVLLSIKTDDKTKQDIKEFASELGISSTAFVNMVVKQAIRDRKIVLSSSLEPTAFLEKTIKQAETDHKADKGITHTKGSKDTLKHLDSLMKK